MSAETPFKKARTNINTQLNNYMDLYSDDNSRDLVQQRTHVDSISKTGVIKVQYNITKHILYYGKIYFIYN